MVFFLNNTKTFIISLFKNLINNVYLLNNEANIIHYDLRYENILYHDDKLKIIDFGISKSKKNIYDDIYNLIKDGLAFYPFEFIIIYFIKYIEKNIRKENPILEKNIDIISEFNVNLYTTNENTGLFTKHYNFNKLFIFEYHIISEDLITLSELDEKLFIEENNDLSYIEKIEMREKILIKISNLLSIKYKENIINIIKSGITNADDILNELLGEDYYKKIDIFYLGTLMIKYHDIYKTTCIFDVNIIKNCFNFDNIKKRHTIDQLKKANIRSDYYDDEYRDYIIGGKNDIHNMKKDIIMSAFKPKDIINPPKKKYIRYNKYIDDIRMDTFIPKDINDMIKILEINNDDKIKDIFFKQKDLLIKEENIFNLNKIETDNVINFIVDLNDIKKEDEINNIKTILENI